MYLTPNSGFAKRVINYLGFMVTAILASFRAERPDVVIATTRSSSSASPVPSSRS